MTKRSVVKAAFCIVFAFFYVGLFYPDPFFFAFGLGRHKWLYFANLSLRLLIPLTVAVVYLLFRWKVLDTTKTLLIGMGGAIGAVVFVPVLWILFSIQHKNSIKGFHTFLQLKPSVIDTVEEDEYPIFFLGGSTTQWTNSKRQGWPHMVEEKLRGWGYSKVRSHNQGRQWYTSLHTLINYETNVRPVKPKMIVVMHGINDLLVNADFSYLSNGAFRSDYGHFLGPVVNLVKQPSWLGRAWIFLRGCFYHSRRKLINKKKFKGFEPFQRNLNTIIDLAKLDGTEVVLMTQPSSLKPNMKPDELLKLVMLQFEAVGPQSKWSLETATRGMKEYNEIVREVARQRGVKLVDLDAAIPKNFKYFVDEVHYSDEAFPVIAEIVSEAVSIALNESGVGKE